MSVKLPKADVPECALKGCKRIGVLKVIVMDLVTMREAEQAGFHELFCCKTHALRVLQKTKMPRYSKKRVQSAASTSKLKLMHKAFVRAAKRKAPEPE